MTIIVDGQEQDAGAAEVELRDVFYGVRIRTDVGTFGIAQRDGGIEVCLDGELVWASEHRST